MPTCCCLTFMCCQPCLPNFQRFQSCTSWTPFCIFSFCYFSYVVASGTYPSVAVSWRDQICLPRLAEHDHHIRHPPFQSCPYPNLNLLDNTDWFWTLIVDGLLGALPRALPAFKIFPELTLVACKETQTLLTLWIQKWMQVVAGVKRAFWKQQILV